LKAKTQESEVLLDKQAWPLVMVSFPPGKITNRAFETYLNNLEALFLTETQYVTVTDSTLLQTSINAEQWAMLDRWIAKNASLIASLSLGNAIVVNSSLIRGVLTALYWVKKPPNPHKVVSSVQAGIAWGITQLLNQGAISSEQAGKIKRELASFRNPYSRATPSVVPTLDSDLELKSAGPYGPVIDMFEEPAFLVSLSGELIFANHAAKRVFPTAPSWLAQAVATSDEFTSQLCRVARLERDEESIYLVIPCVESHPPTQFSNRQIVKLAPSLKRIASLLAQGFSDKEIAAATDLTLATVRTYVSRVFKHVGVHSRGEYMKLHHNQTRWR